MRDCCNGSTFVLELKLVVLLLLVFELEPTPAPALALAPVADTEIFDDSRHKLSHHCVFVQPENSILDLICRSPAGAAKTRGSIGAAHADLILIPRIEQTQFGRDALRNIYSPTRSPQ